VIQPVRLLISASVGAALGAAQFGIALAGMHRADQAEGLAGIGVAAKYAAGWLAVTVILLFVVCGALRLRWWALAALALLAGELLIMMVLWRFNPFFGLHGDRRAVLFIPGAVAVSTMGPLLWERRLRRIGPIDSPPDPE
jgi:hypothetical protein